MLFVTTPDLAIEALMRTGRTSPLFLGDPSEDIWIPSISEPRIRRQLARLHPGRRLILDEVSLRLMTRLRRRSPDYPLEHQVIGQNAEVEWILHQLDLRFGVEPLYRAGQGLVVAQLARRAK